MENSSRLKTKSFQISEKKIGKKVMIILPLDVRFYKKKKKKEFRTNYPISSPFSYNLFIERHVEHLGEVNYECLFKINFIHDDYRLYSGKYVHVYRHLP